MNHLLLRLVMCVLVLPSLPVLGSVSPPEEDFVEFKYLKMAVSERVPFGEDREWIQVETPWGGNLWGLIDQHGAFLLGPEYPSIEVHGDLTIVDYSRDLYGLPAKGEMDKPFNAIVDRNGIRVRTNRLVALQPPDGESHGHNLGIEFVPELGVIQTRSENIPTSLISKEMAATPGLAFGYLDYSMTPDRQAILEPILGEQYLHRVTPVEAAAFTPNYTGLYRSNGLFGFVVGTHLEGVKANGVIRSRDLTPPRFSKLIPTDLALWKATPNEQHWVGLEESQWRRVHIDAQGTMQLDAAVQWVQGPDDWLVQLEDGGLRWEKNQGIYSAIETLGNVPQCFAARTPQGWGILTSRGNALMAHEYDSAKAAWTALYQELVEAGDQSAGFQALLGGTLEILEEGDLASVIAKVEEWPEVLFLLGAQENSSLTASVMAHFEGAQEVKALLPNLFKRYEARQRVRQAWGTASMLEKKNLTVDFSELMLEMESAIEEEGVWAARFVASQALALHADVPFEVYFDFMAQAPLPPASVGGRDLYGFALDEDERERLAQFAGSDTNQSGYFLPNYLGTGVAYSNQLLYEMDVRRTRCFIRYSNSHNYYRKRVGVDPLKPEHLFIEDLPLTRNTPQLQGLLAKNMPTIYPDEYSGYGFGRAFESATRALLLAPDNPEVWLARSRSVVRTLATVGFCHSRFWSDYKGKMNAPTGYFETPGGIPTPLDLWPVMRSRVVADLAMAKQLGADASELQASNLNVLFCDAAYEALSEGTILSQPPEAVTDLANSLISAGNDRLGIQIAEQLEDNRTIWLIKDEEWRLAVLKLEANQARIITQWEKDYPVWIRKARAADAAEAARQAEYEERLAEAMASGDEDMWMDESSGGYAYNAAVNYSFKSTAFDDAYIESKFEQYANTMGGGSFKSWVLSGNSNSWTVQ